MITFLISAGIVSAIGLVCGILLMIATKFLSVKTDERIGKIRKCLPGINCGACGFSGCDSYAEALILKDDIKTNLCIPGADVVANNISEILGVDASRADDLVAYIQCNGNQDVTEKRFNYSGIATCSAASMLYGGDGLCTFGCIGFGDCAKVCPTDSITVEKGIAHINPLTCIACGKCLKRCPKQIISLRDRSKPVFVACKNTDNGAVARKKCKNACIACGKCEKACPNDAIHVENNLARINYDRCIVCKKCVEVCPVKCILINENKGFEA